MVVEGVDVLSLVVDGAIERICNIWRKKTFELNLEWNRHKSEFPSMTTTHIAMNRNLIDTASVYF